MSLLFGWVAVTGSQRRDRAAVAHLFRCSIAIPPSPPLCLLRSAPAGALLEVPLRAYLSSVASQSPHAPSSSAHDAILAVDLLPCRSAAALTVRVGNGARNRLFTDHLLMATGPVEGEAGGVGGGWRIVSKTFAPRPWPGAAA